LSYDRGGKRAAQLKAVGRRYSQILIIGE
jgi:hypothetical protein